MFTVNSIGAEVPISVQLIDSTADLLAQHSLTRVVTQHGAWEQH